jgi:hypothetical protein
MGSMGTLNLSIGPIKGVFRIIEVKIKGEPQRTSAEDAVHPSIDHGISVRRK